MVWLKIIDSLKTTDLSTFIIGLAVISYSTLAFLLCGLYLSFT